MDIITVQLSGHKHRGLCADHVTDEEDIVDGMQKLRTVYPNLMRLEYDNRRTRENQEIPWYRNGEKEIRAGIF